MHADRDGGHLTRASPLEHSPPKAQRRHPSAARAETVTSARTASTSATPGIAHLRCEEPTTKPEDGHEVSAPDPRTARRRPVQARPRNACSSTMSGANDGRSCCVATYFA